MNSSKAIVDDGFLRLKDYLIATTGLAYYADKDEDLAHRVQRSMARLGLADYTSYAELLADDERAGPEMDALIAELTIGETYFFRQPEQFEALARVVVPDILERNRTSRCLRDHQPAPREPGRGRLVAGGRG